MDSLALLPKTSFNNRCCTIVRRPTVDADAGEVFVVDRLPVDLLPDVLLAEVLLPLGLADDMVGAVLLWRSCHEKSHSGHTPYRSSLAVSLSACTFLLVHHQ